METDNQRRDGILTALAEHGGLAYRLAGRYMQKCGLPWQYKQDYVHDLLVKAAEVYPRYAHLPDDELIRVLSRTMQNHYIDITLKNVRQSYQRPKDVHFCSFQRRSEDYGPGEEPAPGSHFAAPTPPPSDYRDVDDAIRTVGPLFGLTEEERAVMSRTADGITAAEIALDLGLSISTVENRIKSARRKFKEKPRLIAEHLR